MPSNRSDRPAGRGVDLPASCTDRDVAGLSRDTPPMGGQERPLLTGECEVWWASPEGVRPAHLALLSVTEQDRYDRLRRPADRARFAVAAALLRLVAARHTGQDPAAVTVDRSCSQCGRMH